MKNTFPTLSTCEPNNEQRIFYTAELNFRILNTNRVCVISCARVDNVTELETFWKDRLIVSRNFKDNNSKHMPSANWVRV